MICANLPCRPSCVLYLINHPLRNKSFWNLMYVFNSSVLQLNVLPVDLHLTKPTFNIVCHDPVFIRKFLYVCVLVTTYLLYYFGNHFLLCVNNSNVSFAQILIQLNIKEYNFCIIILKEVNRN